MSEEFIDHLNTAVVELHYSDRSKFIREAIVEKLNRHGVETSAHYINPPTRLAPRTSTPAKFQKLPKKTKGQSIAGRPKPEKAPR